MLSAALFRHDHGCSRVGIGVGIGVSNRRNGDAHRGEACPTSGRGAGVAREQVIIVIRSQPACAPAGPGLAPKADTWHLPWFSGSEPCVCVYLYEVAWFGQTSTRRQFSCVSPTQCYLSHNLCQHAARDLARCPGHRLQCGRIIFFRTLHSAIPSFLRSLYVHRGFGSPDLGRNFHSLLCAPASTNTDAVAGTNPSNAPTVTIADRHTHHATNAVANTGARARGKLQVARCCGRDI